MVEKRMGGVLWYSRFLYSVVYYILWFSHFFNHRFSGYMRYFVPPRYGYQVRIYGWYFALFASPASPSPRSQPPHGAGTDSGKDSGEKFYLMHAIFSLFASLFLIFVYLAAAERLPSTVIRLRFSFVRTDSRKTHPVPFSAATDGPFAVCTGLCVLFSLFFYPFFTFFLYGNRRVAAYPLRFGRRENPYAAYVSRISATPIITEGRYLSSTVDGFSENPA